MNLSKKDLYEAFGAYFIKNTFDKDESCVFCKKKITKDMWRVRKGGFAMCMDCAEDLGHGMMSVKCYGHPNLKGWELIRLRAEPDYPCYCKGCENVCFGGEKYWYKSSESFVLCLTCVKALYKGGSTSK